MGMAKKRGWAVEERPVKPEELADASEVFLCGTAAEIVPVGSVDGHHYQSGPYARSLMADFQRLVRQADSEGFGESTHLAPASESLAA
jgi:branched-chain amino acid aminotransferase